MMVRKIRKKQEDIAAGSGSDAIASNEDLLTLILLFLPVKSLLRFKLVSKHWLSLITSPHFSDLKSKRFSKHISGLLLRRLYKRPNFNPKYEFIPLDEDGDRSVARQTRRISPMTRPNFVHTEGKIYVLQSCNGLLLCRDELCRGSSGARESKYYVFNPTTKEYIAAPVNRVLDSGIVDPVLVVNLAFDPRKSPYFKLICFYCSHKPTSSKCFDLGIYSSETGVLRQIDSYLSRIEPNYREGVYWNGAVNWIDDTYDGIYFNVDEERLGTFPMPPRSEGIRKPVARYYGESSDHLHLILTVFSFITKFDVYEMEKDYSGWFVKFHVNLQPALDSFPGPNIILHFGVLGVVRKDEDRKSFLVLSIPCKVIRFNFEDGSFSKLCDFASTNDHVYDWRLSTQFIGSLYRL